jgi:hypothetical protein
MPDYKRTYIYPQSAVSYRVNACSPLLNGASAIEVVVDEMISGPSAQTAKQFSDFYSSPRLRAQYLKALEVLSDKLLGTWSRVFPERALVPLQGAEAFFEPFVQFGVTVYDACAQMLLSSIQLEDSYLHVLNNDLKTLIYERICPYREKPVRTLQEAIKADERGEWPGEWTLRMTHSWRLFEHPRRDANHDRVRCEFIDIYFRPGLWEELNHSIQKAVSTRTIHWMAAHAEFLADAAEANSPSPDVRTRIPTTATVQSALTTGQAGQESGRPATSADSSLPVGHNPESAIPWTGEAVDNKAWARRLREARDKAKLSRRAAAQKLKSMGGVQITDGAIKKHEEGAAFPRPEVRIGYAKIYGITEETLFGLRD